MGRGVGAGKVSWKRQIGLNIAVQKALLVSTERGCDYEYEYDLNQWNDTKLNKMIVCIYASSYDHYCMDQRGARRAGGERTQPYGLSLVVRSRASVGSNFEVGETFCRPPCEILNLKKYSSSESLYLRLLRIRLAAHRKQISKAVALMYASATEPLPSPSSSPRR